MEAPDGERLSYHKLCELNLFKVAVQSSSLHAVFKGHAEPRKMNFHSPAIKKGSIMHVHVGMFPFHISYAVALVPFKIFTHWTVGGVCCRIYCRFLFTGIFKHYTWLGRNGKAYEKYRH